MTGQRFVVIGLARARAAWFTNAARWSNTGAVPVEFLKCVSMVEVTTRIASGRPVSAVILDGSLPGLDRDLFDQCRQHGAAVIVVADPRTQRDWLEPGASAVLDAQFERADYLDVLARHCQPVATHTGPSSHAIAAEGATPAAWTGSLIAVVGGHGSGGSTIAMGVSQGLAAMPGNSGSVVLADLALRADLAMYHDAGDVVPGVQELVELHRLGRPSGTDIANQLHLVENRQYALLLGLRRTRDWTALRPRAVDAALTSLASTYRYVVCDLEADFDGEELTGSADVEDRNCLSRLSALAADLVFIVGSAGLKGLHDLTRLRHELGDLGISAERLIPVVNRAPRSTRSKAEFSETLAKLTPDAWASTPLFLRDHRSLESIHRLAGPLPEALCRPLATAALAHLAAHPHVVREVEPSPLRRTIEHSEHSNRKAS